MGEAAQRGALFQWTGLVVGVHLDDVAFAVEFIAVVVGTIQRGARLAQVPACVLVVRAAGFPAVTRCCALRHAVAVERSDALVAARGIVRGRAGEVAGPVFFARQVGVPRGAAGAAVVERAAELGAVRRILGLDQRIAAHRARDLDVGLLVHAAVEARALHVFPLAVGGAHFDDGQAVQRHLLVDFQGRTRQGIGAAIGVHEERGQAFVGGRFVVHGQQAARDAGGRWGAVSGQREEFHAVVMVARTVFEVGIGAVVLVGGRAGRKRIAQRVDHAGGVAGRDDDGVGQALADGGEAEQLFDRRRRRRAHWRRRGGDNRIVIRTAARGQAEGAQQCSGGRGSAAAQHVAAAQAGVHDGAELFVRRSIQIDIIMGG